MKKYPFYTQLTENPEKPKQKAHININAYMHCVLR